MGIGGGSKFTLEKTWRASGVGTTTFNAPGNITLPFGRSFVNVTGRGGSSTSSTTPGNISSYNPSSSGNANYNSASPGNANYNPDSPGNANYNPISPGNANYNPISPGNANYNPISEGNANYNSTSPGTASYNPVVTEPYFGVSVARFAYVTTPFFSPGNFYYSNYEGISGVCPADFYYTYTYPAFNPTYGPQTAYAVQYDDYFCTIAGYNTTGGNFAGSNPPSGGNIANYNAPSGGNYAGANPSSGGNYAGANPSSGGNFAGSNPPSGGNIASYNSPTGGNIASYNSPVPSTANYNSPTPTTVSGNPSSALGVSMSGGASGSGTFVSPTVINSYAYPDNATYPVSVGSGGYVTVDIK